MEIRRVPQEVGAALVVEVVRDRTIVVAGADREHARPGPAQQRRCGESVVGDGAVQQMCETVIARAPEQHGFSAQPVDPQGHIGG